MRPFHSLLSISIITLSLYADALQLNSEFPLIQPIAVEEAPLEQKEEPVEIAPTPVPVPVPAPVPQEKDSDGDGVIDKLDLCPNTPVGTPVNDTGCEIDSDGDGVADSKDKCPNTSKDFMVDGYGCPQTATLKVTFASNEYKITNEIIDEIKEFALFLQENRGYQVVIIGYTDNKGNKQKNKLLSQNRANSIKEALVRYGIKETRLTSIGRGIENPVADNATPEGRAANRRIEVELIQ